ncbi:MAG TPA: NADH-quinone oxidoreductase subunit N [Lacunisphaera sp.]|nr:NADH-quinone oxidoreductase subunit N [Lacunisphaera sp.]
MTTELLQKIADTNEWWAIAPELLLACGALLLLGLEIFLPKKDQRFIPHFALTVQATVLVLLVAGFYSGFAGAVTFGGLLRHTFLGHVGRVFFLLSSLLVCFLAGICLPKSRMPRVEFYHIVMVVAAAMMLLVQSNHFVMFFVALETVTIGFYILVSYYRDRPLTLEAGLKYLVLGALSSGIMLFGIVLLYGAVGRVEAGGVVHTGFEFDVAADFLRQNPDSFLGRAGALLVLAGVAFKIGAFPFQVWIPDVYQGAPTPTTAFLAVASKAAGFGVLLTLVGTVFAPLQSLLVPVLSLLAAATILFGNLSALTQRNAKRLMGLSGVSHAGYLLLGVVASFTVSWAAAAVWFYLFTYLLASMAVFGVMAHVAGADDANQEVDHYERLARHRPFLAAVLVAALGSLAGIPPLAGFMGKLLVFVAAFQAHLYGLLVVAIIGVVLSIYYYFGWIKAAVFESPAVEEAPAADTPVPAAPNWTGRLVLGALALASILLGFYPGPLTNWLPFQ